MALYTIKDLENLTGIMAHTIRIWEKRYNLVAPRRTDSNIRMYGDEDLKRLLNISILYRHGVKISRIACLTNDELTEQILRLSHQAGDYDNQVESLVIAMIDLDEITFDRLLSKAFVQMGFENAILHVIYPFFDRVGMLWQVGTINPAQEHFVSNLIRQRLIVAIDGLIPLKQKRPKTFLLFLPENEFHEIGLLFYHYLIRKHGHKVIYLGQSVPFGDLVEVSAIRGIDCLFTSFTAGMGDTSIRDYLLKLKKSFPDKKIFVSSLYLREKEKDIPRGIILVRTPEAFAERLVSI